MFDFTAYLCLLLSSLCHRRNSSKSSTSANSGLKSNFIETGPQVLSKVTIGTPEIANKIQSQEGFQMHNPYFQQQQHFRPQQGNFRPQLPPFQRSPLPVRYYQPILNQSQINSNAFIQSHSQSLGMSPTSSDSSQITNTRPRLIQPESLPRNQMCQICLQIEMAYESQAELLQADVLTMKNVLLDYNNIVSSSMKMKNQNKTLKENVDRLETEKRDLDRRYCEIFTQHDQMETDLMKARKTLQDEQQSYQQLKMKFEILERDYFEIKSKFNLDEQMKAEIDELRVQKLEYESSNRNELKIRKKLETETRRKKDLQQLYESKASEAKVLKAKLELAEKEIKKLSRKGGRNKKNNDKPVDDESSSRVQSDHFDEEVVEEAVVGNILDKAGLGELENIGKQKNKVTGTVHSEGSKSERAKRAAKRQAKREPEPEPEEIMPQIETEVDRLVEVIPLTVEPPEINEDENDLNTKTLTSSALDDAFGDIGKNEAFEEAESIELPNSPSKSKPKIQTPKSPEKKVVLRRSKRNMTPVSDTEKNTSQPAQKKSKPINSSPEVPSLPSPSEFIAPPTRKRTAHTQIVKNEAVTNPRSRNNSENKLQDNLKKLNPKLGEEFNKEKTHRFLTAKVKKVCDIKPENHDLGLSLSSDSEVESIQMSSPRIGRSRNTSTSLTIPTYSNQTSTQSKRSSNSGVQPDLLLDLQVSDSNTEMETESREKQQTSKKSKKKSKKSKKSKTTDQAYEE